jgi:Putative peptidoglycan binding domain
MTRSAVGAPPGWRDDLTSPDGRGPADDTLPGVRRRRRSLLASGIVVLLVAAVAVVVVWTGDDDDGGGASAGSGATERVQRRTLTQTEDVTGTLDFGDTRNVAAGREGTVTSLAATGSTVGRGETLFSVDRRPTVLLLGEVPLYRDLAEGVGDGPDVAQLEANLAALGFTDNGALTVDEQFDDSTTDAVQAWQEARSVEVTGRITRGDAVFVPGPARIADPPVDVGAPVQADSPAVAYTSSTHVVRVQLEAGQADLAQVDNAVSVSLPDGSETDGRVKTVADSGTASEGSADASTGQSGDAPTASSGEGEQSGDAAATIEVTISLDDPAAVGSYTTASVDVGFTQSRRDDVLTVPVVALVGLLEGGYAVEVPGPGDSSRLVPVAAGMFADGEVVVAE